MDRWRRTYIAWGFGDLDHRWERFLVYGAAAAFWVHLSVWMLTRDGLIPGVEGVQGWLLLTFIAIPGNARAVFLIALGPIHRGEWNTTWLTARANPLNREGGRPHHRMRHGDTARRLWSTGNTLIWVLAGLTLFAVCGGYWLTGGTIVEPSDSNTSPPRLRNQAEKEYMLTLINQARTEAGAPPVVMGVNNVAQIRAEQLLRDCILSHWGTDGLKPYMRYSLAGGYQANGENALTYNECGLLDTWLQWNEDPLEMVRRSVQDWLDSPGHRETMLDSSYRKVNIGLAWDRNTFKAVQHFEGDYVDFTKVPTVQDRELALEGRLKNGKEFDSGHPLVALLVYDRKPGTLTQGQLAQTSCYSHGEIIAGLIPPSFPLQDDFEYTATVEQPECPDPYKIGRTAGRPESRQGMVKVWEEAREKSKRVRESETSIYVTKPRELTAEGDHFALTADLTGLLEEHGPGVYTVILIARLAEDPGDEGEIISEFSIFHGVRTPPTYGQGT